MTGTMNRLKIQKYVFVKRERERLALRRARRVQESDDGREDEPVHQEKRGEDHVGERRQEVRPPLPADDGEELPHDGGLRRLGGRARRDRGRRLLVTGEPDEDVFERELLASELTQDPSARDSGAEDVLPGVGTRRAFEPRPGLAVASLLGDRRDARQPLEDRSRVHASREGGPDDRRPGELALELGHRSLRDDPAPVDDQDPVADGVDLREDVGREQDGPLAAEAADRLPDPDDLPRIEPHRRLVEDEDGRTVDERSREGRPLAETLREVFHLPVRHLCQEAALDRLADSPGDLRAADAFEAGAVGQVLPDAHLGIEGRGFGEVTEARARALRVGHDVVSRDPGRAGGRRQEPGQDPHRGRLPRPVRAEKPDDLSFGHGERDVGDGDLGREALREVFDFDHSEVARKGARNLARIRGGNGEGNPVIPRGAAARNRVLFPERDRIPRFARDDK